MRAFPSATKAGANLKRIIAGLPGTGRQYLEPLVLALAEGRCGLIELGPADPWSSNVITLYPAQKPLAIVFDDRDGVGPRQWKAAPRARWWVKAAYVAAGCRPVGARLLELTDAHKRLVVIENYRRARGSLGGVAEELPVAQVCAAAGAGRSDCRSLHPCPCARRGGASAHDAH